MKITYNPKLKEFARNLRNQSTKSEIILWNRLKRKQVMGYDFHRQKPIGNFIVDFFCNKLRLAIELDGVTHNYEEVVKKDKLKEERLSKIGIKVLRFTDNDVVSNIDGVLTVILDYIEKFEKK